MKTFLSCWLGGIAICAMLTAGPDSPLGTLNIGTGFVIGLGLWFVLKLIEGGKEGHTTGS